MTSVMPAWKQALIEKKRKKEQEEKAKIQVEEELPEWKKKLLAKKRGLSLHGAETNGLDGQGNIASYEKHDQKRNSFSSNTTERELESNLSKSPPKVIIIPKGSSQSGSQGRQHSFVARSATQPDQQRENKQLTQKLSKNGQEKINKQGIVPEDEENSSKVSYEHIKTPSELRKLFGVVSRDSVSFGSVSKEPSKKVLNQQTPAHRDVSTKPQRSSSTRDYEQSQKPSVNTHAQTYSRESMKGKEVEVELPNPHHTPAKNEDNNVIISSKENDNEISAHSEDDNKIKTIKDDEIPADVHVNVIRTKFGPSGNFRLLRSSSSDNLLNSKQPVSPRSRGKPPPLNKRWSADVSGILSPTRSTSEDEDTFDLLHNDTHTKRMRSKSMGDVRLPLDHHSYDIEPVVNLKHRASVSSGIERRLQVLLHNLSVADGKQDDYEEVGDVENTDIHVDQNLHARDHHLQDDSRKNISRGASTGKQIDEDDLPPRIRKASWYNPEENVKDTRFIFTEQDYDMNKQPVVESTSSHSASHDFHKSSIAQDKIEAKHDFGKNEAAIDKGKQFPNLKSGVQFKERAPQKTISMNGNISHEPVDDEPDKDEKPAKGSVYKLSSIFGASISKGNKKAKSKTNHADSKTSQEELLNQENVSKTEKKNSQKRIFPWSKKQKKPEPVKEVKEEQTKPFIGASILRPVHQEVVEQKITNNMTLVISSNAGSYQPKLRQKPPQLNLANQAPATGHAHSRSDQNSQVKGKNENQLSVGVRKPEDMMVTVIDVPSPRSPNDVEVSAIDMPETPSPTPVSVIDVPESPEHDVKVSVIDMPDDDTDSDDSDSSSSGMSGSYDINPVMESIGEEDEEEEDIDNVPVSYVGDSTYMKVPEVIFESKVENIKSCMSSSLHSRKRKAKVGFNNNNLIKVHDYPSEACMQYHYDQHSKENGGQTLYQYRPASLQGIEGNVREREKEKEEIKEKKDKRVTKHKAFESTDKTEISVAPAITYLDEGEAFTSSSSSGALLF